MIHEASAAELEGWDARTVDVHGGHVYQSRAWAEHRAALGWEPWFVILDQVRAALVLTRRWPLIGGRSAYIPRGPAGTDRPADDAAHLAALADWLAARGVDVVASDAEIPAANVAYRQRLEGAGFHAIPEIQPSRHRVSLALARDTDDAAVRAGLSKGTRQRVAAAERDAITVVRHDAAAWTGDHLLFARPTEPADAALERFATLLEATGERRGFRFGPRAAFLAWWRRALAAGHLVYLEALDRDASGGAAEDGGPALLGGLILYRHGDRLSTVHSGDTPGRRDVHPGVMHLLRWRAIQLAIREGRTEMDLGGVDTAPDHREPRSGEPMAGLYEHKRSFGAAWVEMTGAHERVMRPWRYGAGRLTARLGRAVGR
jgi:lipid II:glycine glycyltransferase (peptidoglycan interpeptide bridge formation enzyme)